MFISTEMTQLQGRVSFSIRPAPMATKLEATDSQDYTLHSASREDAPEQGYALEAESTILTGTKLAVVFAAL
jgi:hypothetical protein